MHKKTILLSGNPNVGKTSLFNLLTGLRGHTGNWSGKTVDVMQGTLKKNKEYELVDLPGTYSLLHLSTEELIARDSILFEKYYKNVVVVDSSSLEKNLNLLLQIIEVNPNVILCLNLDDIARKEGVFVDAKRLSNLLGIEVIKCSVKEKTGIDELIKSFESEKVSHFNITYEILEEKIEELNKLIDLFNLPISSRFISLRLLEGDKSIISSIKKYYKVNILTKEVNDILRDISSNEVIDIISTKLNNVVNDITNEVVIKRKNNKDKTLLFDKKITSKKYGMLFSILFLTMIFYITITLANYPSEFLSDCFNKLEDFLLNFCINNNVSHYIYEPLILGVYKTLTWVVSVMLPPMAIFFSLFALAEECGLLPRIAFNFDKIFKKCCCSGKQALTMCMGFGCNACAVVGSRIIDSPRDKLVAIITNNFVPCNGRFPFLIAIITMFFVIGSNNFIAALILTGLILISIIVSLIISKILSCTILKGIPSHFTLELPKYKKPKILSSVYRSLVDKTIFVLLRAIKVAAPAGIIIWLMANVNINSISLLTYISDFLDPFASLMGLDGIILLAFILALPANEILFPIIIMSYLMKNSMLEMQDLNSLKALLIDNGWTIMTALSVCLFSLMHFPCATTLLTIKKEVGTKWMVYSFIIPTLTGISILIVLNTIYLLF